MVKNTKRGNHRDASHRSQAEIEILVKSVPEPRCRKHRQHTITLLVHTLIQALEHSDNPSSPSLPIDSVRELECYSVVTDSSLREHVRNIRDDSIRKACLSKG
jgi:hypothetical protein